MKKLILIAALALPIASFAGGPSIGGATMIPKFIEGSTPTNNNRVPFWCWVEFYGLSPNATYHFFTAIDTVGGNTNGAGLPLLIDHNTRVFRRILNPSMTNVSGYDSLTANSSGYFAGWMGVEPTGNFRFAPGTILNFKVMLNDGAGGTTVAYRLYSPNQITVLNFGTTSMSATQGSALYDSVNAAPKNFIGVYDNILANGRPVAFGVVENDSLMLRQFASTANFYRTRVDSLNYHYGVIIPNNLPTGVNALVEYGFSNGTAIDTTFDSDGIWCYGTNTVNMATGNAATYLNSTYVLSGTYLMPDTTWTGFSTAFTANYTSPNATYSWNYGDLGTGTGASTTHTYITPGVYNGQLIVSTGGCSDTVNQTVVVMLSTGVPSVMPLSLQIMPNPTNGEIIITTKDMNEKTVSIVNVLGEQLDSQVLTGNSLRVELGAYPKGIYLVRVKDNVTGRTGTKRIVLQ